MPGTTNDPATFSDRHIGADDTAQAKMLAELGYPSLEQLIAAAVPAGIVSPEPLRLPAAATEAEALAELAGLAGRNRPGVAMIGCGYHPTITPPVTSTGCTRRTRAAPARCATCAPSRPRLALAGQRSP
jgi:glycine dehydrogenase